MKKVLWGVGLVVAGAGLFGLVWISHGEVDKATAARPSSSGAPIVGMGTGNQAAPIPPQAPHPPFVMPAELLHLRAAQEAALRTDPNLAAEYKQILEALQEQQNEFDAAMIKMDPSVAPIMAKVNALRQSNGANTPSSTPSPR